MELCISTRMTLGVMNRQCLDWSHIESGSRKNRGVQPLAEEFIFLFEKRGNGEQRERICACGGI